MASPLGSLQDNEQNKFRIDSENCATVAVVETYPGDGTIGGTPILHDPNLAVDVPRLATVNHDFIVTNGQIVEIHQININATGDAQFELEIGDGAATEVFETKDCFDIDSPLVVPFQKPIIRVGTVNGLTIRISKTNFANVAQDLFSKMILVVR